MAYEPCLSITREPFSLLYAYKISNGLCFSSWYTLKTCEAMLEALQADIICFQGAQTFMQRAVHLTEAGMPAQK